MPIILLPGCAFHKDERDKMQAAIRIHLEVNPDSTSFSSKAQVYREQPVEISVDHSPFLHEVQVMNARIVDVGGGFDLELKFNRQGTWLLESYTTANIGKHLAIFCEFGAKGFHQARWIGAPVIEKRISNGTLRFVADVSRDEAEDIVLGLKNVAKEHEEDNKW